MKAAIEIATELLGYPGDLGDSVNELDLLRKAVVNQAEEIKDFKSGVKNFRCPACNKVSGPFYPVDLIHELEEKVEELEAYRAAGKAMAIKEMKMVERDLEASITIQRQLQAIREAEEIINTSGFEITAELQWQDLANRWLAKYGEKK